MAAVGGSACRDWSLGPGGAWEASRPVSGLGASVVGRAWEAAPRLLAPGGLAAGELGRAWEAPSAPRATDPLDAGRAWEAASPQPAVRLADSVAVLGGAWEASSTAATAVPSVVGRLAARWQAWEARQAPERVLEWVRDGFPVTISDRRALESAARAGRPSGTVEDPAWLDAEVARLVAEGAVEAVAHRPHVVSPVFLVDKPGPKRFRLVVDMRMLNLALPHRVAKQEGLADLLRLGGRGWWACSWDLENGYHHLDIRPESRDLLGFGWRERWYRYCVLPFGMSLAPWAFTRVVRVLVARWRALGIHAWAYLDDFALLAPTREALLAARAIAGADMEALGWVRSPTKGHWEPTQTFTVLGFRIDLLLGRVGLNPDKALAVRTTCTRLARRAQASVRELASAAGKLGALYPGWTMARLLARPLMSLVARALPPEASSLWSWHSDGTMADDRRFLLLREVRAAYRLVVPLDAASSSALLEAATALAQPLELWRPAWTPPSVMHLYTDASLGGWGAVCGRAAPASGPWPRSEESGTPGAINRLELLAVERALGALTPQLAGKMVHLHVDSSVALAVLRKGSGVPHLHEPALRVWRMAASLHVRLVAVSWVASADNPADEPSRRYGGAPERPVRQPGPGPRPSMDDWGLAPGAFLALTARWGPFSVDAFASASSALVPRFWTREREPGAEGVDAFAQDWAAERLLLLVPAFRLLHRCLAQLAATGGSGVLVVPEWPAQPWWPRLLAVATGWWRLHPWDFRRVAGYAEPLAQPAWRLWAVRVQGSRARSAAWA